MIRLLTFTFLISLFLATTSTAQSELMGTWKRVQDESTNEKELFEGNVLEVKDINDDYLGVLIQVVEDAKRYGYKTGHFKWKNFKKISEEKYLIDLLLMDTDENYEFRKIVYLKANLTVKDPNTILIRIGDHPRVFSGKIQKYIRVGSEVL